MAEFYQENEHTIVSRTDAVTAPIVLRVALS